MKTAMNQLQPLARADHRILKRARAIADLAGNKNFAQAPQAEALQHGSRMGDV